jgi:hypothetical protein
MDLFGTNTIVDKKMAVMSDDHIYRYMLGRTWDESKPSVLFIMLNPSTADDRLDDPTIRRCIGYAKKWGYGSLYVGNLFAMRATNPKELLTAENPTGETVKENRKYLDEMIDKCSLVICAWGNAPIESETKLPLFKNEKFHHLGLTKDGNPKHPLYLKKNLKPIRFERIKDRAYYMETKLAVEFYLPFGERMVMSHSAEGMVYIGDCYGVDSLSFIDAWTAIEKIGQYGVSTTGEIAVPLPSGAVHTGTFAELSAIVKAIYKCHCKPKSTDLPLNAPYRVGRSSGRVVLDADSKEVVKFPKTKEKWAQDYCRYLNLKADETT